MYEFQYTGASSSEKISIWMRERKSGYTKTLDSSFYRTQATLMFSLGGVVQKPKEETPTIYRADVVGERTKHFDRSAVTPGERKKNIYNCL